jgi:hypothetical protein
MIRYLSRKRMLTKLLMDGIIHTHMLDDGRGAGAQQINKASCRYADAGPERLLEIDGVSWMESPASHHPGLQGIHDH